MADTIDIQSSTNRFSSLKHDWLNTNSYKKGESLVKTMPDPEDSSNNAASTEWVNNFVSGKMSPTPTINTPILTPMWFDHAVDSSAWAKSEFNRTSDTNYGWLYASRYDRIFQHLKNDIETSDHVEREESYYDTEQLKTVTIKFYLANDGHKIIVTSGDGDNSDGLFKSCGVAWFYTYDSRNRRFKLPRSRFGFQGIKENGSVGKYDKAGLPDISISEEHSWPSVNCSFTPPSLSQASGSGSASFSVDTDSGGSHTHTIGTGGSHSHSIVVGKGNCTCSTLNTVKNSHVSSPTSNYATTEEGEHTHTITASGGHTHHVSGSVSVNISNISGNITGGDVTASLNGGSISVGLTKDGDVYGKSNTVQPPSTEMYLFFSTGYEDTSIAPYGFGGGVIDGTTCKEPSIGKSISKNEFTKIYDVDNDCFLFISVSGNVSTDTEVKMTLNEHPIINHSSKFNFNGFSCGVPAHKGSVINGFSTVDGLSASFYEYQLYSTDPQIAMPDYSESPYELQIQTGTWTASKNGWVFMRETERSSDIHIVKVNGNEISIPTNNGQYNLGNISFPVAKGDIVSFSGIHGAVFYPCRAVPQTEPISYVIKTEFGNYATELDLTKTYKVGDYVRTKTDGVIVYLVCTNDGTFSSSNFQTVDESNVPTWWYRKYSDGWCEQGGRKTIAIPQMASGEIELKLPMSGSTYNVSATVHYNYNDVVFTTPPVVSVSPKDENTICYIESTVGGARDTRPFSWEVKGKCD